MVKISAEENQDPYGSANYCQEMPTAAHSIFKSRLSMCVYVHAHALSLSDKQMKVFCVIVSCAVILIRFVLRRKGDILLSLRVVL